MATVIKRVTAFLEALKTLERIITILHEQQALYAAHPTAENEELFVIVRDATIQRFEYCTDLIWKVIKDYLEQIEKVDVMNSSPRGIVREAVRIKLFSEAEGKESMKMADSRNRTSHIYHVEMAEEIAQRIPEYYVFMKKIIDRIQSGIAKK